MSNGIVSNAGTSFAAPLVLRQAIALSTSLQYNITPLTAKALLVHHAEPKDFRVMKLDGDVFLMILVILSTVVIMK